jgi:hypothetical protein
VAIGESTGGGVYGTTSIVKVPEVFIGGEPLSVTVTPIGSFPSAWFGGTVQAKRPELGSNVAPDGTPEVRL